MSAGNMSVNKYHKNQAVWSKASAQKKCLKRSSHFLTEEEMAVYKRGRNSKSGSVAKNASMMDYRESNWSGSFGWIFISGRRYGPHHRIDRDRFDLNKKRRNRRRT